MTSSSRAGLVAVYLLLAAGCTGERAQILVDLRTDWVAGVDFDGVRVEIDDSSIPAVNVVAAVGDPYSVGVRVADFDDLSGGAHGIAISLLAPRTGSVVATRSVVVDVADGGRAAITVVLARADATCSADSDCEAPVACVTGTCVEDECLLVPVASACAAGEYCDLSAGCALVPGGDAGVDAGTPDALVVDSATTDAGDAGPDGSGPDGGTAARLVAWYRCESVSAGVVADDLGAHDGFCLSGARCPSTRPGMVGDACSFDGDDVVRIADHADFDAADGLSVALWARWDPTTSNASAFGKPYGSGSLDSYQLLFQAIGAYTQVNFVSTNGSDIDTAPGELEEPSGWHHIAIVFDGAFKTLFIDGVAAISASAVIFDDDQDLFLGADQNAGSPALEFTGELDEVRFYDGALTSTEITALATP